MNLNELTKKALETKSFYEAREQSESKKQWGTEEIYQALVSDVGDLGRVILAKEGFYDLTDTDTSLKHEFSEILYAVLLLANEYNIDLEQSFFDEMKKQQEKLS